MLSLCENEKIHNLALLIKKNEFVYMVNLLLEAEKRRILAFRNTRSDEDKQIILSAKYLLMEKMSISEVEAHKYIQKKSMDMRVKFVNAVENLIRKYG